MFGGYFILGTSGTENQISLLRRGYKESPVPAASPQSFVLNFKNFLFPAGLWKGTVKNRKEALDDRLNCHGSLLLNPDMALETEGLHVARSQGGVQAARLGEVHNLQ